MNTQHRKNRITILVIFAMSIIPFAIAWFLAANPQSVKLGTNKGDLITPPLTTEYSEFSGYDSFSSENIKELQGHWILINPIPTESCAEACLEAIYKTRQISLMMGKDIARIRRVALLFNQSGQVILNEKWQADKRLLKILASKTLQEKLAKIFADGKPDGLMIIMDPLGNLMMKYEVGFDPYQVKNDLSKLLRISQIG